MNLTFEIPMLKAIRSTLLVLNIYSSCLHLVGPTDMCILMYKLNWAWRLLSRRIELAWNCARRKLYSTASLNTALCLALFPEFALVLDVDLYSRNLILYRNGATRLLVHGVKCNTWQQDLSRIGNNITVIIIPSLYRLRDRLFVRLYVPISYIRIAWLEYLTVDSDCLTVVLLLDLWLSSRPSVILYMSGLSDWP